MSYQTVDFPSLISHQSLCNDYAAEILFTCPYALADIVREAKDYACINGIGCRPNRKSNTDSIQMFPFTLFPSPFPRMEFEVANDVQTICNELIHKVAFDQTFLNQALETTVKVDSFTSALMNINNQVEKIGSSQPFCFGSFRTDYMFDTSVTGLQSNIHHKLRQVESNTIAAGLPGIAPRVGLMHRYLTAKYLPQNVPYLPSNTATINVVKSFIESYDLYGKSLAVILFIVEDWSVNICDQRIIEQQICETRPDIKVIRRSFTDLHPNGKNPIKVNENRELIVDGNEVALVYFRYCYDPNQYNQPDSWDLRLQIELSKAIKCPSINYHLSGVKKLQQILANQEVLEKFLSSKNAQILMHTFTGLYGLDMNDDSGDEALQMVLRSPHKYVLKPQREGGGNNWYGNEIVKVLEPIKNSEEREAYILMNLISPLVTKNYFISPNQECAPPVEITSELGIFGSILGSKNAIIFNRKDGHLLRSKKVGVNEGGIMSGSGAIDSPLLID